MGGMSKKLKDLMERAEHWPETAQEELADAMEEIETRHAGPYRLTEDERTGVERGLKDMRAGRFASDEKIAAIFGKARSPRA
jgi:hypothetical protein